MARELANVEFQVNADSDTYDWARNLQATSPGSMRQGSRVVAARK
jgi:hypothetical protein